MLNFTTFSYYSSSAITLLKNFNWWVIPLVMFKKPVLITIKNQPSFFVSNLMDIWTLKEVIVDQQYEKFKKLSTRLETVIDVGAAIGEFSIYAAKKSKNVIAYEPDKERLGLMKKNLELNQISNVKLNAVAAKSLGQILSGVKQCDFFKIDCEGGEYPIFKAAKKTDLTKIKFIAMEAHKFNKTMEKKYFELINFLSQNGFEVKVVPNAVHVEICFLFAKRKK